MATDGANIVSKRSAAEAGYFTDPFISHFAVHKRRTPLVNRGYWIRAWTMDLVMGWFLDSIGRREPSQVLSLGAGFDTTFFRLAASGRLPAGLQYFEVDFSETVAQKQALIQACPELSLLAAGRGSGSGTSCEAAAGTLPPPRYAAAGADLREASELEAALQGLEGAIVDFAVPTLVLAEVSLVYLPPAGADAVLRWVAGSLPRALMACYEQVLPGDGFGRVMCQHFEGIGSPLQSISRYPSVEAQVRRHRACGLEPLLASDMNAMLAQVPIDVRRRAFGLEPFDEFEEWRLKCGHYVLVCSRTERLTPRLDTQLLNILPQLPSQRAVREGEGSVTVSRPGIGACLVGDGLCKRSSHCAALVRDAWVLVFGGYGPDSAGRHGRRANAFLVDCAALTARSLRVEGPLHAETSVHAACVAVPAGVLLMGGRAAPTTSATLATGSGQMAVTLLSLPSDLAGDGLLQAHARVLPAAGAPGADPPAPTARWRHSAVALPGEPALVAVFGGRDATTVFDDLWLLDIEEGRWEQVCPLGKEAPPQRHSHAAAPAPYTAGCEGWTPLMLVTGGLDVEEEPLSDAYLLEFRGPVGRGGEARWRRLPASGQLCPRFGHTAHVWRGQALLLGGVASGPGATSGGDAPLEWWCLEAQGSGCPEPGSVQRAALEAVAAACAGMPAGPHLLHGHASVLLPGPLPCERAIAEALGAPRREMSASALAAVLVLGGGGTCFSFGTHVNSAALLLPLPLTLGASGSARGSA